jgi:hypothetical protein
MNMTFIQLAEFASSWKRHRLSDEDLMALEKHLHENPAAGQVMRGTGGLRKTRFAPPSRHGGKSGGYRVGYAYFRVASTIYLVMIFAKKDQQNLTAAQCHYVKQLMESLSKFHRGRPPQE